MTLLSCPACGADDLVVDASGAPVCRKCGTQLPVRLSPCPICGHLNLPGSEQCVVCAEPLSIAARVVSRQAGVQSLPWLDRVRSQAGDLKATGERASQSRMAVFQRAEDRREVELRRMTSVQARKDRKLVVLAAATVGLLLLVLGTLALVSIF